MPLIQHPFPPDHISTRIAKGEISLATPLRWYGRATTEPARLPWGYSFDVALSGVDTSSGRIPVVGALRVGFTPVEGDLKAPTIQAGDEISVLSQAHLSQIYRDSGAFNRREFLATYSPMATQSMQAVL